ncbi:MAG: hypothetical protein K0S07_1383 [Chlamydiales bacterium]|jgi:predicted N-formylglutamate amidohydrolase|nr:hypothetical protein [Chlamydiales bacterium]
MKEMQLIVTCEHGGKEVPPKWRHLFADQAPLNTHRGFDIGALAAAKALSCAFHAPLFFSEVTRLLVELNRSLHHPHLFAKKAELSSLEREQILLEFYHPYRTQVEQAIESSIEHSNKTLHLSIHSFTPVLNGETRSADIALLYDPKRGQEKAFAAAWKSSLKALLPGKRIRSNYPYRGTFDGFTTYLRKRFPEERYLGIEIELNQIHAGSSGFTALQDALHQSLSQIMPLKTGGERCSV